VAPLAVELVVVGLGRVARPALVVVALVKLVPLVELVVGRVPVAGQARLVAAIGRVRVVVWRSAPVLGWLVVRLVAALGVFRGRMMVAWPATADMGLFRRLMPVRLADLAAGGCRRLPVVAVMVGVLAGRRRRVGVAVIWARRWMRVLGLLVGVCWAVTAVMTGSIAGRAGSLTARWTPVSLTAKQRRRRLVVAPRRLACRRWGRRPRSRSPVRGRLGAGGLTRCQARRCLGMVGISRSVNSHPNRLTAVQVVVGVTRAVQLLGGVGLGMVRVRICLAGE
jgi:hypothetical protein